MAGLPSLVHQQRSFVRSGATRPLEFRREQLRNLGHALARHEPDLLAALQADLRKSPYQAYGTELGMVVTEVSHVIRRLPTWMAPRRRRTPLISWPGRSFTQAEPRGVACIIGPWNYPLQLVLLPLVGSMAAGNCSILKPSEFAAHTASALAELIMTTFPPEYVAVVQGGREQAEALLRERFDFIFFTGSTAAGRSVMAAAASHLTPVALELGGKSPCLVAADAPLETTARRIAWGKFMNAGQTCVAPDFVLADRRIFSPLLEALKRAVREFYGDDPRQSPEYGRIINDRHFDRLTACLSHGQVALGGQAERSSLYIAPTILTGVAPDSPAMQDEIFGPILPVLAYDRLDDAFALLRDRPTPLALYLFSKDRSVQERVLRETRSGGVCVNDTVLQIVGRDLPFGGLGDSGMGAYHGQASFDCFSHQRSVLRRSLAPDPKLRYPPARLSLNGLKRAYRFLLGG